MIFTSNLSNYKIFNFTIKLLLNLELSKYNKTKRLIKPRLLKIIC